MDKVFISNTEEDTAELARKIAALSKRGDVWALSGTLGAGKSVFARAFIQSLTDAKEVPSPTFTLVQMYNADTFDIFHYDLYRLENPAEIFELGVEEAFYAGVCLVEWPEKMGAFAPRDMWRVHIDVENGVRKITISAATEEKISRLQNV
ncbi:MAG: tRNA (adenosine(37)-N6)-threonylcarbamoyltransferase complex ATPase subunit type 1 TsaE [Alphaproteobacteria bacterium]|nr:tRNA (adenosine(37)-N6)-threonylcarbamoyltransferase complex ATPase subunit type 1 TsaE [Alphaproteobacteria bacterium]